MRRMGNLYPLIPIRENLCLAFWKAARGKRGRRDVIEFQRRFDENIRIMMDQLDRREPDIGHYRFFMVHDPKPRSICAALFPERVLHHAIMNVCEPALESYAIHDSYACRKGKGNRKALARAQAFSRKYPWYLKLDVRKYFDSIDQAVLLRLLARRFKDKDILDLFGKLFATYNTAPGKGMPIGNLISQHLANFYLGPLDHWIKETQQVKGYLRYMDDFLVFGNSRAVLNDLLRRIVIFLKEELALTLKENIQLNRCDRGIPFLGYRVFPGRIRLSPKSRKRFIDKFRAYERQWVDGEWSTDELVRHVEPLIEFTKVADAGPFRQSVIERYGVSSY